MRCVYVILGQDCGLLEHRDPTLHRFLTFSKECTTVHRHTRFLINMCGMNEFSNLIDNRVSKKLFMNYLLGYLYLRVILTLEKPSR